VSGLTGFKKASRDLKKGQRPKFCFVDDERKLGKLVQRALKFHIFEDQLAS